MDKALLKKINIEVLVRIFAIILAVIFFMPMYTARDEDKERSLSQYDTALAGNISYSDKSDDTLKRNDIELKLGYFIPLALSLAQLILGAAFPVIGMGLTLANAAVTVYCRNIAELYMLDQLTNDTVFSTTLLYNVYIILSIAIIILLAANMMKLPAIISELYTKLRKKSA